MKNKFIIAILGILILILSFVNATTLEGYGKTTTVSVGGTTYSVKQWGGSTIEPKVGFWVWIGTASLTDSTNKERTAEYLGLGESYNFNTLPLTITLNSYDYANTKVADFTLTSGGSGGGNPSCEDECNNHNERWCSGNNIYSCYYDADTGCYKQGLQDTCGSTQKCENGYCAEQDCVDECFFSGEQCVNGDVYECRTSSKGCRYHFMVEDCDYTDKCVNAQCVKNCQSKYSTGCYNGDLWYLDSCGTYEIIKENCVYDCKNKICINQLCNSHASKKCYDNRPYWYDSCGNKEEYVKACDYTNEKCENGECVKIQNDECSDGQIKCLNEEEYQECKFMSNYNSYRWHPTVKSCGENEKCENNKCIYVTSIETPYTNESNENIKSSQTNENKTQTIKKCSFFGWWCTEEIIKNTDVNIVPIKTEQNLPTESKNNTNLKQKDIPDEDLKTIADDVVPSAIEDTATLFYLFIEDTKQTCDDTKANQLQCRNVFTIGKRSIRCGGWYDVEKCKDKERCNNGICVPLSQLEDCPYDCCKNLEGYKDKEVCKENEFCARVEEGIINNGVKGLYEFFNSKKWPKTYNCKNALGELIK